MGMFDWVKFEVPCPKCTALVDGFQSKDGFCVLDNIDFWQVDNFYSHCRGCGARIVYNLKPNMRLKMPIEAYNLSVDGKTTND